MDLRIVNTCNSDCIYCLEQSLRKKKKFLTKNEIFDILLWEKDKEVLSFYWWNPLMHPDLLEIISFGKEIWYKNISLLTNTYSLNEKLILELKTSWLTGISFYFHTLLENKHNIVVRSWISLWDLLKNINLIVNSWLNYKCIIHVNKQNIETLYKNVAYLSKKFWVKKFEFIKYHLVSRAWKDFKDLLEYTAWDEKKYLFYLNSIINKLSLDAHFVKF